MNVIIEKRPIVGLRNIYGSDAPAKAALDYLSNYSRAMKFSTATRIASKSGISYAEAVRVFKVFEHLGLGEFKNGRRGGMTRIEWRYHLGAIGRAAQGGTEDIPTIDPDFAEVEGEGNLAAGVSGDVEEFIVHRFTLRPDMTLQFTLPTNLTEREADRLSVFLKSLPFN